MKKQAKQYIIILGLIFIPLIQAFTTKPINSIFDLSQVIIQNPDTLKALPYPIPPDDGDPVQNLFNQSPLYLNEPDNITHEIIYDPLTNQYTFVSKIGDLRIQQPTTMSQSEFLDYQNKKGVMEYWKERRSQNSRSTTDGNSIIPPIYLGGEAFDLIFGSNTVDIRPQGTALLTFGIRHNYRKDPSLSVRQQKQTNFEFDQELQMNVMAKIGDKINFNINYNTESLFNYENKTSLKYEGKEDEIIQLLEAGNVSFPLNSTLITGCQQLMGIKSKLKFGKTTITSIISYQESESQNVTVKGGAQTSEFKMSALDYEANRHFFLSQYFRDMYEESLSALPMVSSSINITKVEVWVTNTNSSTQDTRNILALNDLAEGKEQWIYSDEIHPSNNTNIYPRNAANTLLSRFDTLQIRDISTVTNYMINDPLKVGKTGYMVAGRDFEKVENARRLSPSEYSLNPKLGFISLNTNLNSNQTLAVAYQYTIVGQNEVYQVGEFSDQGISTPKVLVVKLLRGTTVNTKMPIWNLMMKNVYNIRAFQVSSTDFTLNIFYTGNSNSTPTGFYTEGPESVKGASLLHLMGLDNLTQQNNPIAGGDGVFDFINGASTSGGTINASNGRIYFPVLEPFGSHIRNKIFPNDPDLANKYAYDSLYTATKTVAEQCSEKNKYMLQGFYSSQSGSEISLNTMNVAEGSVNVTAGGIQLTENVDYTVDYTLGRVTIINEGILNSGTPINISLESNSGFNALRKTMLGTRVEHEFDPDFRVGATVLHLNERSYTQKINYGEEAIANTIFGADMSLHKETRWLTNFIDKLPGISTKAPSRINFSGEVARFIPGLSRSSLERGTSYLDDFEGAKSTIDLRQFSTWKMASTPQNQTDLFPEAAPGTGLAYGKNRAKLAWYIIDPSVFYDRKQSLLPPNVKPNELAKNSVRQVLESEIFPTKDIAAGTPTNVSVLNLAYFPEERGPYNFDVTPSPFSAGISADGTLNNPQSRWGGIMRRIESTDFEATNIEYIEFWLMDPFADEEYANNPGKLYFNLGDISEDILRDGRKFYENGLPISEVVENVDTTIWGRVPTLQDLVSSFHPDSEARKFQDVGFDGLRNEDERTFFNDTYLEAIKAMYGEDSPAYQMAYKDPSADDFHYFRGSDYDKDDKYSSVLERYKQFNGAEGNSPADTDRTENYSTEGSRVPDGEDINNDNTLSESERYYQYEIDLDPAKMTVGKNFIADIYEANNIPLANGEIGQVKWYQFRIPIKQPTKVVGLIEDFSSIRFMRIFVREFNKPIVLRFATLDLVKGEWRTYTQNILSPGEYLPNDISSQTTFDISAVNIEENGRRSPVPYVIPPGIKQEIYYGMTSNLRANEQSLQLTVQNLIDGDARAIYKTTDFDFRQYKYLKMFVHAEAANDTEYLEDQDLTLFMRIGSDFTENYYEYELPLKTTPWGTAYTDEYGIWPEINNIEIEFEDLVEVKMNRNKAMNQPNSNVRLNYVYAEKFLKDNVNGRDYYHTIKVLGNPSISDVEAIMIGVRNPKRQSLNTNDDGLSKSAVIWINELRVTDLNSNGGWAATGRIETTLADLGRVVVSGSHSSPGFASLDSDITSNTFEGTTSFDVATDLEMGKFIENTGMKIPVHFDYGQTTIAPKYNPYDPDIKLKEALAMLETPEQQDSLRSMIHDVVRYKNINLMNVRKERTQKKNKNDKTEAKAPDIKEPGRGAKNSRNITSMPKIHFYDIENFNLSFSYNEVYQENTDIKSHLTQTYRGSLGYNYNGNPKNVMPFAKMKWASSPYLQLIKDFNFYYMPKSIVFNTEMYRYYSERHMRNKSAGLIILNPMYSKEWNWNRDFQFRFDLTKALSLEYSARAEAYIYEPAGNPDKGTEEWKINRDTIMSELKGLGSMSRFQQDVNVTYTVPINKIPIFNWINLSANYRGSYFWTASAQSIQQRLGNSIENSNSMQASGTLDFVKLYNKVPYFKNLNTPQRKNNKNSKDNTKGGRNNDKDKDKVADSTNKVKPTKETGKIILDNTLKVLMGIKKASISYTQNNGQYLPGFMPEPDYLGMNGSSWAPGAGFVFGGTADIYSQAVENGWLTLDSILSDAYNRKKTENFNYRVNVEPLQGLRIDVTGNRSYAEQIQHYFRANEAGQFDIFTPTNGGNFSSSYNLMRTSFVRDYSYNSTTGNSSDGSPLFDNLLAYRKIIANRIAEQNPMWVSQVQQYVYDSIGGDYYPLGYGAASMEVIMYSFIAAYSGQDPNSMSLKPFPNFPLPNWTVSYNGLTNIPAVSNVFRTVSINHGYRSSYSISSWASNMYYDPNNTIQTYENSDLIIPKYDMGQMVLSEQYSPLLGVDLGLKNTMTYKFEFKKARTLTLSFANNQLTEINTREIVIGAGYRFKNLNFIVSSLTGGNAKNVNNDLVLKLDLGFRKDKTILRRIDEANCQVSAGQNKMNIYLTADYTFSKRLTAQAFFKRDMSDPFIANSFKTTTTFAGVTLRFSLAQ